jgi:hypothetical protein
MVAMWVEMKVVSMGENLAELKVAPLVEKTADCWVEMLVVSSVVLKGEMKAVELVDDLAEMLVDRKADWKAGN